MARKNDYGTRNYDYGDLVCCVKEWSQIDRRVALKFGNNFQVILFLFLNRDHRSFFIFVARAEQQSLLWLSAAGGWWLLAVRRCSVSFARPRIFNQETTCGSWYGRSSTIYFINRTVCIQFAIVGSFVTCLVIGNPSTS